MTDTGTAAATSTESLAFEDVLADDGTRLRAWTNDPHGTTPGPTVLLCNGLGTNPWAWPALLRADAGVRVVSWNHRGVGGSDRPRDPRRVHIEDFVTDALSVMDHFGLERVVVMGWSMGVNTAFELAVRHPERVAGLVAVAGVPGDTFRTMLGPLHLPHVVARTATVTLARGFRVGGALVAPLTARLPVGRRAVAALSHSGFMLPVADPEITARAVKEFLSTPLGWYFHLALTTSQHARVRLSRVQAPALFVAGRWDLLAGARDMASAAERMAQATYVELDGSHFLSLEQPEVVHRLLLEFLDEVAP